MQRVAAKLGFGPAPVSIDEYEDAAGFETGFEADASGQPEPEVPVNPPCRAGASAGACFVSGVAAITLKSSMWPGAEYRILLGFLQGCEFFGTALTGFYCSVHLKEVRADVR